MYSHYAVGTPDRSVSDRDFRKLMDIIAVNEDLLKRALGTETLAVIHLRGRLWFPWFTVHGAAEEIGVYHDLIAGLCDLAGSSTYNPMCGYGTQPKKRTMLRFLEELGFTRCRQKPAWDILLQNFPWQRFLAQRLIPAFYKA